MRYFIAYVIEGEAGAWHQALAKEIVERFDTWKIHEKVPPHVTLFRPFKCDDIAPVEALLGEWAASRTAPGNFLMADYGTFNDKVIFVEAQADEKVRTTVMDLRGKLAALSLVPLEEYPWYPHATLAHRVPDETIRSIHYFVRTKSKPAFMVPFDNVSLLRFDEKAGKWEVCIRHVLRLSS